VASLEKAIDGLVLAFATSQDAYYVHFFDVTVWCNPSESSEKDLKDLDGWKGYMAPLKGEKPKPPQHGTSAWNLEDHIISKHMEQETTDGIVGISTC
jgi:hypothetical protein